jgi:Tol biopolymer transport system component
MEGNQEGLDPVADPLAAPAVPADPTEVPVSVSAPTEPAVEPVAAEVLAKPAVPADVKAKRKRKALWAVLILLVVLGGGGAAAAKFGVYRKLHDRYTAGTVSLKVLEDSKFALAGVSVNIHGTTYTTDANGRVTLENIPAGSYSYTLTKQGYEDAQGTVSLHKGDNDLQLLALTKLPDKVYSVKGFVKDVISGLPVVNVQVALGSKTAVTDPSGAYAFANVIPADLTLSYSKSGYTDKQVPAKVVDQDILTASVPLVPAGQLIFVSNRTGQRYLYTSAYDGSGQQIFASSGVGEDFGPVVAPDNKHVVFSSTRDKAKDGFGNDAVKLYVATLDGKTVTKVSDDVATTILPVWSPNGQKLYFSAYSSVKYDQSVYRVYDVTTGKLTDLGEQANETAFSPDGKLIAYYTFGSEDAPAASPTPSPSPSPTATPDPSPSPSPLPSPTPVPQKVNLNIIKVLNLVTGERKTIVKKEQYLSSLQFSADATGLSYETIIDGVRRRFLVKLSDGSESEVAPLAVAKRKVVPSPDQKQQAFVEERDGRMDLYVTDANGQNEKRLTTIGVLNDQVLPHWDATGQYITVAVHREGEDGIYAVALAGGDPKKVTDYYAEK